MTVRGRHRRQGRHRGGPARAWPSRILAGALIPRSAMGRRLCAVSIVDALGSGMYYTGSVLYFTLVVGFTPAQVGAGLSAGGVAGLLLGVPIGRLSDRVGAGRVYIALQVVRGACYLAYCTAPPFAAFLAVAATVGVTDAAIPAVHQAVVGATVPPDERVDTLAKIRATRNVAFGAGALLATVAIASRRPEAYLALIAGNAASFLLMAWLLARVGIGRVTTTPRTGRTAPRRRFALTNTGGRYLVSAVLSGVLAVHSTLLVVAVPLWFTRHTVAPAWVVGALIALNTALAVAFQAPAARLSTTVDGALRTASRTGLALAGFAVACLATSWTTSTWVVVGIAVAAVISLTMAEMWQSASSWTLSYEFANPDLRSESLATYQLGMTAQTVIAPLLVTQMVLGTPYGWLYLAGTAVAAGYLQALLWRSSRARAATPTQELVSAT